jgi:dTDP-4-dehydrorhamnose 3,5-epimerase
MPSLDSQPPVVIPFQADSTKIDGLWIIQMKQVTDERGTIREFYRESTFLEAGLPSLGTWLQINITETRQGAVRGLHGEDMDKLIAVVEGEAFGAYLDTRPDSPSAGQVVGVRLTKGTQVLVPRGVCNGFQSVSPGHTQYLYSFNAEWVPGMAGQSANPFDPEIGIEWPITVDPTDRSLVSAKDAAAT